MNSEIAIGLQWRRCASSPSACVYGFPARRRFAPWPRMTEQNGAHTPTIKSAPPPYAFSISAVIGRLRTRLPLAAKMALVTAGMAGGRAGSPRPVGG